MKISGIFLIVVLFAAAASAGTNNGIWVGAVPDVSAGGVAVDTNPPHSYLESMYGWYDHVVNAKLTAMDDLSGVLAVSYMIDGSMPEVSYSPDTDLRFDTEGVHRIEYFALDSAGNAEQVRTSQVKLDFTPPEVSIAVPGKRTYLRSDIVKVNFSAVDSLSGIFYVSASINGIPVNNLQEFDMLSLRPGRYEFRAAAHDLASNTGISTLNFTVVSDINSLAALNRRGIDNGLISDTATAESLTLKAALAMQEIRAGRNEEANRIIKSYINEIEAQKGKTITGYWADILTTEASYVYISNVNSA